MSELQFYKTLHLSGTDERDIINLSTLTQDALCPITSMTYNKSNNTFTLMMNRFCWEMCDHHGHHDSFFRVHSALIIQNVSGVLKRNFHQAGAIRTLNLLTLSLGQTKNDQSIRLLFSGDMEIDLNVSTVDIKLYDFQHPWPTKKKPIHWHEHELLLAGQL